MRNSSGKSQTRLENSRAHLTKGIIGSLILKNIKFQRSLVFKRLGIQWLSANTALALSAKHMEDGRVLHSEDIQNKSKITAKLTLSMQREFNPYDLSCQDILCTLIQSWTELHSNGTVALRHLRQSLPQNSTHFVHSIQSFERSTYSIQSLLIIHKTRPECLHVLL